MSEPFAAGSQASIFRAFDTIMGESCLIKTGKSVREEALLSLRLNHPYVLQPLDFGWNGDTFFAAYPEITQPSLASLKGKGSAELQRVALQISEVLCFLHHRGWLYNDFKPEHFLVLDDGIRIVDLGLCTPVRNSRNGSGTYAYSGTFPFISPERLTGRMHDERSDIFAFGMMLLDLHVPLDDTKMEPTLSNLVELQKRGKKLSGFWRELIFEMTALEPSQRIGSAAELWKTLLPESGRKNFLFFPVPGKAIQKTSVPSEGVVFVYSTSRMNLQEFESGALARCWEEGCSTFRFDCDRVDMEHAFQALCRVLVGNTTPDVYAALQCLQTFSSGNPVMVIFSLTEKLNARQRSILGYALSSLGRSRSIRILLTTRENVPEAARDDWHYLEIPHLSGNDVQQTVQMIFPAHSISSRMLAGARDSYLQPEQILAELQKKLPKSGYSAWPAAAKQETGRVAFERLTPREKRALAGVAIAGGSLRRSRLAALVSADSSDLQYLGERLFMKGYAQSHQDQLALSVPRQDILQRYRKSQIRAFAQSLLADWPLTEDSEALYTTARYAEDLKTAGTVSLREGEEALSSGMVSAAMEWFWRAFACHAELPKSLLFRMAGCFLKRGRLNRSRKIIRQIRTKFGCSFRLAEYMLDYYHRGNQLSRAAVLAQKVAVIARTKGLCHLQEYYLIRYSGYLILQNRLAEGDAILDQLMKARSVTGSHKGMVHHFRGLSSYYRGRLEEAVGECESAVEQPHRFQSSSWMNLGVLHIKLLNLDTAEEYVRKAIRIFSKQGDADRLSYACNNLGILFKQKGQIKEARDSYYRGLHLSRLNGNRFMIAAILANIAVTYSMEGRTDRSIDFNRKVVRIARRNNLTELLAAAWTNLGFQHAVLGRYRSAVTYLEKAEKTRKDLQLHAGLADTYEHLGLTHLLARDLSGAGRYFALSQELFQECGDPVEALRQRIYLALVDLRENRIENAKSLFQREEKPKENTFERGLWAFGRAELLLKEEHINREAVRESLHEAEIIFRRLPALFWLGHVHRLRARYFLKMDHYEKAAFSFHSAQNIFSRLGAQREIVSLMKEEGLMKIPENLLDRMLETLPYKMLVMIKEILAEKNTSEMISRILATALDFTDMERAVLILHQDPPRIFESTSIDDASIREICEISYSATEWTADSGKPFVCYDACSNPELRGKPSIVANRIVSIICLPLRAEEKILGYLYLDSREGVETPAPTETMLLEIFASVIALALNTNLLLERSLQENEGFRTSFGLNQEFPEMIGNSKPILEVLHQVHQLLETDLPVMITGETGTGKELVARILHYCGKRKNGPFVAVNSSALSETLFESELFGHEKGSFTGASGLRKGLFEEANNGTLFLDEIGEMPRSMQAKFLRVLQEGEFRRVGGNRTLHTNARIIVATNRSIDQLRESREFREDLYYRITGAQIHLPPLREREEDVPLLAFYFLKSALTAERKKIRGFSPETMELMKSYSWPGNVRQLKNEIERVVAMTEGPWITPADFDANIQKSAQTKADRKHQEGTLREMEKAFILERLKLNDWNILQTARSLGLTRNGLYSKMRLYNISGKRPRSLASR